MTYFEVILKIILETNMDSASSASASASRENEEQLFIHKLNNRVIFTGIGHIHRASRHSDPVAHYELNHKPFKSVRIIGKVKTKPHRIKDNNSITVADESGQIDCFINSKKIEETKHRKEIVYLELEKVENDAAKQDGSEKDKILLRGMSVLLRESLDNLNNNSGFDAEYDLGSYIQVTGVVSEFFDERIIYVDNITKIPDDGHRKNMLSFHKMLCDKTVANY